MAARLRLAVLCLVVGTSAASAKPADLALPALDRHSIHGTISVDPPVARERRVVKRIAKRAKSHTKHKRHASKTRDVHVVVTEPVKAEPGTLLDKARQYLGRNPTGWSSLWCARFIAMIAPEAARKVRNPNWARDWAVLPKTEPKPGAIVVLTRGRGGHIGVLDRFDRNGNPVIISGNHGSKVGEGTYPKSRVLAYVSG